MIRLDILLGLKPGGGRNPTAPYRCVELSWECQVWVCRLPSHHTVRIGVGPVDGSSPGSATSQPQLPPPVLLSFVRVGRPRPRPELVVPRGVRHRQTSADTDSELLCVVFARWLLFAQRAHPVSRVGGHSQLHSYSNRQFRALGDTGVVTTGPTLTHALFVDTNVWNYHYHCDGAYPQPQWDCACSAYKKSLTPSVAVLNWRP